MGLLMEVRKIRPASAPLSTNTDRQEMHMICCSLVCRLQHLMARVVHTGARLPLDRFVVRRTIWGHCCVVLSEDTGYLQRIHIVYVYCKVYIHARALDDERGRTRMMYICMSKYVCLVCKTNIRLFFTDFFRDAICLLPVVVVYSSIRSGLSSSGVGQHILCEGARKKRGCLLRKLRYLPLGNLRVNGKW